jgi:hypothetical protein
VRQAVIQLATQQPLTQQVFNESASTAVRRPYKLALADLGCDLIGRSWRGVVLAPHHVSRARHELCKLDKGYSICICHHRFSRNNYFE